MSIDYGRGQTDIDRKTGIRYGAISQNAIGQARSDSSKPHYGEATCPKCRDAAREYSVESERDTGPYRHYRGCRDYVCDACRPVFDEWRYRPSPLGAVNPDAYETPYCSAATDDALRPFGRAMNRYTDMLRKHGRSY